MRKISIAAAMTLIGCGGATFTAAELGDGGADALLVADAGPEASPQGEDGGADAREDVGSHVETQLDAESDATDASRHDTADAAPDAPACLTNLSGVGAGDFHVSFKLTSSWTAPAGSTLVLVSQRSGGCGTASVFWDVTLNNLGGVVMATDNGDAASYVFVEQGSASVSDGQPHHIAIARVGGQLSIIIDGTLASAMTPDPYAFGSFPALTLGSDSCSTMTPLAGHGTLTDLCLSRP